MHDGDDRDGDDDHDGAVIDEDLLQDDDMDEDEAEDDEVSLGFAVDRSDEPGVLLRNCFPSKLGGAPAWLDPVQLPLRQELQCPVSGLPMHFVMQLYAPINEDPRAFHRIIYLFISPRGSTLGTPGAVRAFRSQLPRANDYYPFDPPDTGEGPTPLSVKAAAVATRRCPHFAEASALQPLPEQSSAMVAPNSETVGAPLDLTDDAGAASAISTMCISPGRFAGYKEYELIVEGEPDKTDGTGDAQADRLLQEYQRKMAAAQTDANANAADDKAEEPDVSAFSAPNEEVSDFCAFTARVQRAPDQCVRYTFAEDAQPLWASRKRRPPAAVPLCPRCGGRRRFEFQVMPQALHFMSIDSEDKDAPDWATIAVYTCAASCPPTPPLDSHGNLVDPLGADSAAAKAAVGRVAMLHDLVGRSELNGQTCTVLEWHDMGSRWAVELSDGEKVRVRSTNLRLDVTVGAQGEREGGYAEEYVWVQTQD